MAVLRRSDGAQFVLRPYRETLSLRRAALIKQELDLLAQANGEYARFYKQGAGRIEAIFASEPGYLLGEAVWRHFGKINDLVYCEALADSQEAILVIVRGGSVYLDAKVSYDELLEELSALNAIKTNYSMYLAGSVLFELFTAAHTEFGFTPEMLASASPTEPGLLDRIIIDSSLQLFPYHQAVNELQLDKGFKTAAVVGWTIAILAVAIWFWQRDTVTHEDKDKQVQQDPYQAYYSALATAEPAQELVQLANQLGLLITMPGWFATKVDYVNGSNTVEVHSYGSPTRALIDWAAANQIKVNFDKGTAVLQLSSQLPIRKRNSDMMPMQTILSKVIDTMMSMTPGKSVAIGASIPKGVYQTTTITITLTKNSSGILLLLSQALSGLPLVLDKTNLTLENGLLSGTIQFTALGS